MAHCVLCMKVLNLLELAGAACVSMYAGFLEEAAPVVQLDELKDVAKLYRELEKQWSQLS